MSDDKPPSRSFFKLFDKFFPKTLKPRAQLMQALEEAEENLVIDPYSRSVIEGALQVESLKVRDVMVPRSKMIMIDSEATTKNLLQVMVASSHSRFPIHNEEQDSILGVVLAKDLLSHFAQNQEEEFNYKEYLRDALSVPESKPLGALLREFQQNKSHMAIVLDEYGEIAGLVTLEDVIEQIVGEIEDEHDKEEDNIIDYGDGRYLLQANTTLTEFNEFFNSSIASDDYDTVAGLVISGFSYLPEQMSEISLHGFQFKVLKTDNRRLHLLEVQHKLSDHKVKE
ncbi:HlyC/CorC family transporter [Candidatus Pseudothioglobus singularis]|uniref:Magnesium and cobalt efflux protein CorC n=1 Tax=Candidatus Pseudothioglobus singularis PS1 TaxID=1125411 RepID=A0A0M3T2A6_9GAMM|nr:transporter associated domain-containing protein [Candidatus Pseudothioglobus singularis]ALE02395.1 cobalt transporter [Candidatus Pseudothioglobus singularis PS1]